MRSSPWKQRDCSTARGYDRDVRTWVTTVAVVLSAAASGAMKIDLGPGDVGRALEIARSRESDRAKFHAAYIQKVDAPFVESVELVTEFRRVVLLAEERAAKGDRLFGYSITSASDALNVWRRRLSVIARVRFHPQNNYVTVPPVNIAADGHDGSLIGVQREAVYALGARAEQAAPLFGAVVDGVFDALALGQGTREFIVSLDGKEFGRATFSLAAVE